jgi:hypothetical protein
VEEENMPIGSISGGSRDFDFNEEEAEVSQLHSPSAVAPAGSEHEDVDVPPESPAGSEESFSDSFDGGSESGAARRAFDPGVIQETPISRALKGKAIENPEPIETEGLNPLLKEDPDIGDVSMSNRKPLSPFAKRVMGPATTALRGVLTPARAIKKAVQSEPKVPPQSPAQIDAQVRKRAAAERAKEMDKLQSLEERRIRQALRGQDRAKKEDPGLS